VIVFAGDVLPQQVDSKQNVVIVQTGIAKKTESKDKGELIEQNVDGLEVRGESGLDFFVRR
jgi:hypothetical protein